jgi:hypothetical protein
LASPHGDLPFVRLRTPQSRSRLFAEVGDGGVAIRCEKFLCIFLDIAGMSQIIILIINFVFSNKSYNGIK